MDVPLSVLDIFSIAKKRCNMFQYPQLSEFSDISDIFLKKNCLINYGLDNDPLYRDLPFTSNSCILLYKTSDSYGHWCIINKNKNRYDFLDSYGEIIDDQLEHIDPKYRKSSNQAKMYLTELLSKSPYKIHYNSDMLQGAGKNIATCGRYCALFLKFNKCTVEQFSRIIIDNARKMNITNDEYVVILTQCLSSLT